MSKATCKTNLAYNISSSASRLTPATTGVYSTTKAAVAAILAKELGPRNIRVNAVNPGMVETAGVHAAGLHEFSVITVPFTSRSARAGPRCRGSTSLH
jgi:NAD(P)-dependent dehydrogenase (short-subunit alcohol dehydrogenase family)